MAGFFVFLGARRLGSMCWSFGSFRFRRCNFMALQQNGWFLCVPGHCSQMVAACVPWHLRL